jgi:ketosteroid isomerase-like protein
MNWLRTSWLVVVVITGFFGLPAWGQAQDEKAVVAQTLKDYYLAFSKLDLQGALAFYHEPVIFITTQSVIAAATRSEAAARVTGLFGSLKAQGYGRSELAELRLKQVSAGLVVASGIAVRYKADGQELGRMGVTYILRKTHEGWKLAVLVSQDPGTALRLD